VTALAQQLDAEVETLDASPGLRISIVGDALAAQVPQAA
jgi:hypothetical protein